MFIEVNTQVSVDDLLKGIVIQSGNDASVALAEHISGSEDVFAQVMNQHAKRLGMNNTSFANSTGMPAPGHVTTARDMAILAVALLRDHPELYHLHAVKEFTYNDIRQNNRNQLLWRDTTVDGIKTGHTEAAGYCLVSSAKRDNMRLISVVMGADGVEARTEFTRALLEYGFRFYESHIAASAGKPIGHEHVWKGEIQNINYGVASDVYVTVPRGHADKLQHKVSLEKPLVAPLENGSRLGQLKIQLADEVLATADIIALQTVAEAGLMGRMLDSIKMMLE
ncbi:MAG: D-alanyl-D-alanine carboxypeptidase family protein, partial [Gammaproteobacteria bacterium]